MEELGSLERTIKPNYKKQLGVLVIGIIALISVVAVPQFWDPHMWFGLPSKQVVTLLSAVLVVITAVQVIRGKTASAVLEVYTNGIKADNFTVSFDELKVIERSGAVSSKIEFDSAGEKHYYNYHISGEDMDYIQSKISKVRRLKAEAEEQKKAEAEQQEAESSEIED